MSSLGASSCAARIFCFTSLQGKYKLNEYIDLLDGPFSSAIQVRISGPDLHDVDVVGLQEALEVLSKLAAVVLHHLCD